MDPYANLAEQRELAAKIIAEMGSESVSTDTLIDWCADLAERVQALDEWRLNGGYDPYLQGFESTNERITLLQALRARKLINDFGAEQAGLIYHPMDLPEGYVQIDLYDHRGQCEFTAGIDKEGRASS
jgi:hypothetical protein